MDNDKIPLLPHLKNSLIRMFRLISEVTTTTNGALGEMQEMVDGATQTAEKAMEGIENIDSVAVTFDQASERANIASGETFSTLFGKIRKWFADLKTVAFSGSYADLSNRPSNMTGATTSAAGKAGFVPAPAAGAATRYLRSDGTWQVPPDNNTTYSAATTSVAGLMSAADKSKLDGIAAGATKNTSVATTTAAGLMSAADKVNLNSLLALTTGYGTYVSSISASGAECVWVKVGRVVCAQFNFTSGVLGISNAGNEICSGLPPANPNGVSLGQLHSEYSTKAAVTIDVGTDGKVYTWYGGAIEASTFYLGNIVYIADS